MNQSISRMSWRGVLRGIGRTLVGIVVGVAIFVAFSAVMRVQGVSLPRPTGPMDVGRTEIAMNDSGRVDPFFSDGRARELAVWIWYPAVEGASGAPAVYLPAAWAPLANDEVPGVLSQDLTTVRTNSIEDAALEGQPPVVVLMPGLGEPVASYSALAEDLASHGYAVIGINPTGSADVVFPDGHLVGATAAGSVSEMAIDQWYDSAARVANVWADDAAFVVRTLSSAPPDVGAFDFEHVAYIGHSMGGAAAFEACGQDAACGAAVDMDGTLWTDVRTTGLEAPSLLLQDDQAGECDAFCQRAAPDFDNAMAANNAERFAIAGSSHMNYSELGLMWGPANSFVLGTIDADRMGVITRDLVRSFLDGHVRDVPLSTFAETSVRYAEVEPVQ
jgi:pimeloyl-ACP methyl ester carboxylesterase